MENYGGLSSDLKHRIASARVAIIGKEADKLIEQAIGHMGFIDVIARQDSHNLPQCDIVICSCTEKENSSRHSPTTTEWGDTTNATSGGHVLQPLERVFESG